jgi:hypothetical protein
MYGKQSSIGQYHKNRYCRKFDGEIRNLPVPLAIYAEEIPDGCRLRTTPTNSSMMN